MMYGVWRKDERVNERTNERTNEWVNERVNDGRVRGKDSADAALKRGIERSLKY